MVQVPGGVHSDRPAALIGRNSQIVDYSENYDCRNSSAHTYAKTLGNDVFKVLRRLTRDTHTRADYSSNLSFRNSKLSFYHYKGKKPLFQGVFLKFNAPLSPSVMDGLNGLPNKSYLLCGLLKL